MIGRSLFRIWQPCLALLSQLFFARDNIFNMPINQTNAMWAKILFIPLLFKIFDKLSCSIEIAWYNQDFQSLNSQPILWAWAKIWIGRHLYKQWIDSMGKISGSFYALSITKHCLLHSTSCVFFMTLVPLVLQFAKKFWKNCLLLIIFQTIITDSKCWKNKWPLGHFQ